MPLSYKTRTYNEPPFDFHGKSILVTGGTGSFGKAFITQLVTKHKPARVVIYSRDELKQFEMGQVLSDQDHPMLRYFIGDVRDAQRLEMAMSGIDYVVHAAALKQVPIAEYNPFECIHTNVIGAENVVRAAIRAGVKKVVALSTDKAANPANVMGASKKLMEDAVLAYAAEGLVPATTARFGLAETGSRTSSITAMGALSPLRGAILVMRV